MKKLHIMVAFAALLVACDRDVPRPGTDNPSPVVSASVVQGRVMALPGGPAFAGGAAEMVAGTEGSSAGELPFRTTVDASGNFRLTLGTPAAAAMAPLAPAYCTSTLTGAAGLRVVEVSEYTLRRDGIRAGSVHEVLPLDADNEDFDGFTLITRIYADREATVRGRVTCSGRVSTYDDLHLKPGWNQVEEFITHNSNSHNGSVVVRVQNRGSQPANFYYDPPLPQTGEFSAIPLGSASHIAVTRGGVTPLPVFVRLPEAGEHTVKVSLVEGPAGLSLDRESFTARSGETVSLGLRAGPELLGGAIVFHPVRLRFEFGEQVYETSLRVQADRQVRVDVPSVLLTADPLVLIPGQTATRDFSAQVSGTELPPTLSFSTGTAAGLTITANTLNVAAGERTVTLTVAAAPTVAPGDYTLPLYALYNGLRDEVGAFRVTVQAPSVRLEAPSVEVVGGESTQLSVTVYSQRGYSGPVTIEATGLPDGVTSSRATVNLPKDGAAIAEVVLTGTAPTFGRWEATVQASLPGNVLRAPLRLTTVPARTLLPTESNSARFAAGPDGTLWWANNNGPLMVLREGEGNRKVADLPDNSVTGLQISRGGTVWILGALRANRLVADELTEFPDPLAGALEHATDAQGRLWRVNGSAAARSVDRLREDGSWEVMHPLPAAAHSWETARIRSDPSGRWMLAVVPGRVTLIDTVAGTGKILTIPGFGPYGQQVAVGPQGQVWAYSRVEYQPRLIELREDGTAVLHPAPSLSGEDPETFGFDGAGRLWMLGHSELHVREGGELRSMTVPHGTAMWPIPATEGGVWVVYSPNHQTRYASRVR